MGNSDLVGVGFSDCLAGVLVLVTEDLGFSGLSRMLRTSSVVSLGGLLNKSAFVATLLVGCFLAELTLGLFKANLDNADDGLRPTGTFSLRSLICFNGVLVCLVGDTSVSASSCFVSVAVLLLPALLGVAVLLLGVLAVAAFLLDLGVLNIASGSSTGNNNPLLLVEADFGAVFSSLPDTSSILTGVTALPALDDLVFLCGKSSLACT